jgi:hypothetical protein
MTILEMIAEWEKGCTCAGPYHDALFAEKKPTSCAECVPCTEGLITAIKNKELKRLKTVEEGTPC